MTWYLPNFNHKEDVELTFPPNSSSGSPYFYIRPDNNVQKEWASSDFSRIDEVVEQPAAGDGAKNTHDGNYVSGMDIFSMGNGITGYYDVTHISIHLRCQCLVSFGGYAKIIVQFRFSSGGSWSYPQAVTSPFGMAWKTFSWSVSGIDQSDLQDLQVGLAAVISANRYGGYVSVDVMYADIEYQENLVEKWAVIVGISDYYDEDYSYILGEEDANDWYNFLSGDTMNFDHISIFGDGTATEDNVKQALITMANSADTNDIIVFTFSGHGSGDLEGTSCLCMWDNIVDEETALFYDSELKNILDDTLAAKIFIFLDSCLSGGFGEDPNNLLDIMYSEHLFLTTTCTMTGAGHDLEDTIHNGAWTYAFLNYSWMIHFGGDAATALEDVFNYAYNGYDTILAAYNHDETIVFPRDRPQKYDGCTSSPFYLMM